MWFPRTPHHLKVQAQSNDAWKRATAWKRIWKGRIETLALYSMLCQVLSLPVSIVALVIAVAA